MLYKCVSVKYNKRGGTEHYNIMDKNGTIISIGAVEIKDKIRKNEISVENLKLTKDNRLRTKGKICNEVYHYEKYSNVCSRIDAYSLVEIICTHLNMVRTKYGTLNVNFSREHRQIKCVLNNDKFDGVALLINTDGYFLAIHHLTNMKSIKKGYALELPILPTLEVHIKYIKNTDLQTSLNIIKNTIDNEVKAMEKGIDMAYKKLLMGV